MSNHYDVLGLTHTATDDEVKKSFKKLAIKYHPDKSSDPRHHELFIKINDAYETLKDPETRKKYDTESGFVNYSRPSGTPSYSLQFAPGSSRSYYTQTTYTRGTGGASYTFTSSTSGAPSYSSYFDLHQRYTARGSDEREKSMREEAERIRRQQEAKAREELEQRMRREEEIQRMKQQAEELRRERSERERQQHEQAAYESAKRDAYRRAWSYDANNDDDDDDASGPNQGSSTNPIVLSDAEEGSDIEITAEKIYPEVEEPEENELEEEESAEEINIQGNVTPDEVEERDDEKYYGETYEYETDGDTTRGDTTKDVEDDDEEDDPLASAFSRDYFGGKTLDELLGFQMNLREKRQPQLNKQYARGKSPPKRYPQSFQPPRSEPPLSDVRSSEPIRSTNGKKMKPNNFFDLNNIADSLDTANEDDFGNSSMNDLLKSLPDEIVAESKRKSSLRNYPPTKKAKYEFIGGESRADTLHRPINKAFNTAHSTIKVSMADLGSDPDILRIKPPILPDIVSDGVNLHEKVLLELKKDYQRKFLEYQKSILQYQNTRRQKDIEYMDVIYSNTSNSLVYDKCLELDEKLSEQYLLQLQEYRKVSNNFNRAIFG